MFAIFSSSFSTAMEFVRYYQRTNKILKLERECYFLFFLFFFFRCECINYRDRVKSDGIFRGPLCHGYHRRISKRATRGARYPLLSIRHRCIDLDVTIIAVRFHIKERSFAIELGIFVMGEGRRCRVINEIDTFCGQRVCDATFHRATSRVVERAPM